MMKKWLLAFLLIGKTIQSAQDTQTRNIIGEEAASWLFNQRIKDGYLPREQGSQLLLCSDELVLSPAVLAHRLGVLTRPYMMILLWVRSPQNPELWISFYRSAATGVLAGFFANQNQEYLFNSLDDAAFWCIEEIKHSYQKDEIELFIADTTFLLGLHALQGDAVPMGLLYAAQEFGFR